MQTKEIYDEIIMMNPQDLQQPIKELNSVMSNWTQPTKALSLAVVFLRLLQRNGLSHVNVLSEAWNLMENDEEGYLK